jgi:hypothetical protein
MHAATTPAPLTIEMLTEPLSVCRLRADARLPDWATRAGSFYSITRTADELSVICATALIPESQTGDDDPSAIVAREDGWRAMKLVGPFALTEVGVLLRIAAPLAAAGISILAIGTFDTDYILVKATRLADALAELRKAGHRVAGSAPVPG